LALSEFHEFSASTRTSGVTISRGVGFVPAKADKSGESRMRFSRKYASRNEEDSGSRDLLVITKGAPDSIRDSVSSVPPDFEPKVSGIASAGETPMAITRNGEAIGII